MAIISRANLSGAMLPDQYVKGIIKEATQASTLMSLARTVQMTRGVAKQPVLTVLPQGAWVSPRDTGRKSTTSMEWADVQLIAEEMAVIVPIPEAVLDDADYDVWGEVIPAIGQEFGRLLDLAGLFGTGPFLAGDSVVEKAIAAGNKLAIGDVLAGIATPNLSDYTNLVMAMVEEDGFLPNGWAAPLSMRSKLRGLKDADGTPIYAGSIAGGMPSTLHGDPLVFSRNGGWDAAATTGAQFVTGDWSKAIVGVRQDVTVKVLSEATITDGAGNVVISLAEQDMVALRVVFRVGFATANPVTALNGNAATRSPFAVLQADATP